MRPLDDREFEGICSWLYDESGIYMNESKKMLVSGRLNKRINQLGLNGFGEYLKILKSKDDEEVQIAINLLTTNETFFFREEKHFEFFEKHIIPEFLTNPSIKVWSAASSTGEEAYSFSLLMAKHLGVLKDWKILGTDINTDVLKRARSGIYPIEGIKHIDESLLKAFCLKGKNKDQEIFRIDDQIRNKVSFTKHNLINVLPTKSNFDLIILRNVLIYFELEDKQKIVQNMIQKLKPNGWFLVGHSESINGYSDQLKQYQPGCYRLESS
ncbi:MAG: protein-glutamate O-methyltransferase CheR [Gammaproteobacteria bacterium]|nr:protein-glutamate O-methyltransferase CheR [Gammaproteobacteria bacterium]